MRVHKDLIKFERIATIKKVRGLGIGKKLMSAMQKYAHNQFPHLTPCMYAQDSAISFYEQIGWTQEGEMFEVAGIMHVKMLYSRKNE